MLLNVAPIRPCPLSCHSSRPFVLLVDDHEPSLQTLKTLVETTGHECVATSSATEALVYCDQRPPCVVVTDLCMPHLDGEGLARWFKARFPDVPILLVTGELLDEATLAHLRSTFQAVMTKPIAVDAFLRLIETLLPS